MPAAPLTGESPVRTPVRAIVVHHDQPERCAETVSLLCAQEEVDVDVVIVDNASQRPAREALDRIPGATVLDAGSNRGFGGGANAGLRAWLDERGGTTWALVLPHDARPRSDCLRRLVEAADAEASVGLASAEYGEGELPVIDAYFGALTAPAAPPAAGGNGFIEAAYAHGTFLLLRRSCLEQVGLFDESYFAYCEEADLALRARRAGWKAGIVHGAIVENPHQGTPVPAIDYLMVRNTILLVARHFGWYHATIRFLLEAFTLPVRAVRPSGRSPWFVPGARALALRDVVIGRRGPPPERLLRRDGR